MSDMRVALLTTVVLFACADPEPPILRDYVEEFASAWVDNRVACGETDPYSLDQSHDHVVWMVCEHYAREAAFSCDDAPRCTPDLTQCMEDVAKMPCVIAEGEHFEWPRSCWCLTRAGC